MKIAAVIPVRNRPVLLLRALRSVQAQTYPVSEIIVVDDASTDETAAVALTVAENDGRIRVIRLPKRRFVGAARNVAWRSTDADWIAFLDSDDEWFPEKTNRQIGLLAGSNAVACFTGCKSRIDNYVYSPPETVNLFDLQGLNILHTPSTAIVRRSALVKVGGFDEHIPTCADWDLWFKLRRLGEIRVVREPMIYYDHEGVDHMSRNFERVLEGHQIMFSRTMSDVRGIIPRSRIKSRHHARLAQILCDNFEMPFSALIYSIRSALRWPNGHALYFFRRCLNKLARKAFGSRFLL